MKPEILSEQPVPISFAKEELERIKKRDGELSFRGKKTEEYFQSFAFLERKRAEELKKKLEALDIPRLRDIHVVKIMDVLPQTLSELKTLLQGYPLTVKEDSMKKIVEVVVKYPAKLK